MCSIQSYNDKWLARRAGPCLLAINYESMTHTDAYIELFPV